MRKLALTLAAAMLSFNCYAGEEINHNNSVLIYGPIQGDVLQRADELLRKAEGGANVNVLINSPGGGVMAGYQFIQAMQIAQQRGSKITCYVSGMAASMAFQILAHCDERNALRFSLLLWHPVRVAGIMVLTPDSAEHLAITMRTLERQLRDELLEAMPISPAEFDFHYLGETMWTAQGLSRVVSGYLNIVDEIPGDSGVWKIKVNYGSNASEGEQSEQTNAPAGGSTEGDGEGQPSDGGMGPEDLWYIWDGWDQYPEPQLLRSCGRLRGAARPC